MIFLKRLTILTKKIKNKRVTHIFFLIGIIYQHREPMNYKTLQGKEIKANETALQTLQGKPFKANETELQTLQGKQFKANETELQTLQSKLFKANETALQKLCRRGVRGTSA